MRSGTVPPADVHLTWAPPGPVGPVAGEGADPLTGPERARAQRLHRTLDRHRSLTGAWLLRRGAADALGVAAPALRVGRECRTCGTGGEDAPHGRPVVLDARTGLPVPGVDVSLSHGGDVVLVAVLVADRGRVGVDVERVDAAGFEGFDATALTAAERDRAAALPDAVRDLHRVRTWTGKEAVLKASGRGLAVDPASFALADADAEVVDVAGLPAGHVGTLAVTGARLPAGSRAVARPGGDLLRP